MALGPSDVDRQEAAGDEGRAPRATLPVADLRRGNSGGQAEQWRRREAEAVRVPCSRGRASWTRRRRGRPSRRPCCELLAATVGVRQPREMAGPTVAGLTEVRHPVVRDRGLLHPVRRPALKRVRCWSARRHSRAQRSAEACLVTLSAVRTIRVLSHMPRAFTRSVMLPSMASQYVVMPASADDSSSNRQTPASQRIRVSSCAAYTSGGPASSCSGKALCTHRVLPAARGYSGRRCSRRAGWLCRAPR